ncbi:hypothetical protein DL765_009020 [Monosporascus sp. GIB2]|nr:hypothetical protein DL765_009020 [Monosporascus sp. GIB2]
MTGTAKNPDALVAPPTDDVDATDFREIDPESGVKRGLRTRHLSMMALAGIIGPGLLVGTGGALSTGGPASLLIGFGIIGTVAFRSRSMSSKFRVCHADLELSQFIIWLAVLANEYNAVTSILVFWSDKVPLWGYFLILWLLGIETFGEAEFWLALIKLLGLCAFYIFAIVYAAGGIKGADAVGFRYWRGPGAFVDGFRGVAAVFVFCATFYAGVESVAVAATETKNPRIAVPLAIRQVFWRIIFVYMGAALFFGMACPANADSLQNGPSRALQSPMTIAIQNAGCSIYISSRTLLFMGQDRKAPKFLGWTDKRGVPIPAIVVANATGALSMMNVSTGAAEAYQYIVNLSGVSTFLVWGSISFIHIRFRRAWALQGYDIQDLPFISLWYPYNAHFGLATNIILALIQGWQTLSPFDAGAFVDAYILLVLFPIIYLAYKVVFRTKFWQLDQIDLQAGRRRDLEEAKELAKGDLGTYQPWWRQLWRNF